MSQQMFSVHVHVVFSTKNREVWFKPEIRNLVFAYMRSILESKKVKVIVINGMADHVHLLFGIQPDMAVADLICALKASTSKWFRRKIPNGVEFFWQRGYSAFGVSASQLPRVARYIRNQQKHHKKLSYLEEHQWFVDTQNGVFDEIGVSPP